MPQITIASTVPASERDTLRCLGVVLRGYAERDDFALTVDVGPARAALAVPVYVDLPDGGGEGAVPIMMAGRTHADWFPTFAGELQCRAQSPRSCGLTLVGRYDVPLRDFGAIVDRGILRGAAERSLRVFVERLRDDVLTEIRRSELGIRTR